MSVYTIARSHVASAITESTTARLPSGDCLHALLVTVVEELKKERGIIDTRRALEFQMNNLADDADYEFMRP